MCRLLLVLSNSVLSTDEIKKYLWFGDHAIFKQCYKEPYTPNDEGNIRNHCLNLDGYGIGFYNTDDNDTPHIYTNVIPSWNDSNLMQLLPFIKTKMLMAHIRAVDPITDADFRNINSTNMTPVHNFNCHPFTYKNYMFCHNGFMQVFNNGKNRKKIINKIDDCLITEIKGNTDSEYLFYLIMTYILAGIGMIESVRKAIKYISRIDNYSVFSMNILLTDGKETVATRYININNYKPPSLYICQKDGITIVTSEPLVKGCCTWKLVERNKILKFHEDDFEVSDL